MKVGIFQSIFQNTQERSSAPDYVHVNLIKIKPVSCQQTWGGTARGTFWELPWARTACQKQYSEGHTLSKLSALVRIVFKGFSAFSEANVL